MTGASETRTRDLLHAIPRKPRSKTRKRRYQRELEFARILCIAVIFASFRPVARSTPRKESVRILHSSNGAELRARYLFTLLLCLGRGLDEIMELVPLGPMD